jgi:hypothetical protein
MATPYTLLPHSYACEACGLLTRVSIRPADGEYHGEVVCMACASEQDEDDEPRRRPLRMREDE